MASKFYFAIFLILSILSCALSNDRSPEELKNILFVGPSEKGHYNMPLDMFRQWDSESNGTLHFHIGLFHVRQSTTHSIRSDLTKYGLSNLSFFECGTFDMFNLGEKNQFARNSQSPFGLGDLKEGESQFGRMTNISINLFNCIDKYVGDSKRIPDFVFSDFTVVSTVMDWAFVNHVPIMSLNPGFKEILLLKADVPFSFNLNEINQVFDIILGHYFDLNWNHELGRIVSHDEKIGTLESYPLIYHLGNIMLKVLHYTLHTFIFPLVQQIDFGLQSTVRSKYPISELEKQKLPFSVASQIPHVTFSPLGLLESHGSLPSNHKFVNPILQKKLQFPQTDPLWMWLIQQTHLEGEAMINNSIILVSFGTAWTLKAEEYSQLVQIFSSILEKDETLSIVFRVTGYSELEWRSWFKNVSPYALQRIFATEGFVPQRQILSLANSALFVSHCGFNSAMESLYYGTPILCIPIAADQFTIANRIYGKKYGSSLLSQMLTRKSHADILPIFHRLLEKNEMGVNLFKERTKIVSSFMQSRSGAEDVKRIMQDTYLTWRLTQEISFKEIGPGISLWNVPSVGFIPLITWGIHVLFFLSALFLPFLLCLRTCCCSRKPNKIKCD